MAPSSKERNLLGNGSTHPTSRFEWGVFFSTRTYLTDGGLRLPYSEDSLYRFGPPSTLSACEVVASVNAMDPISSDTERIVMVDSDGDTLGL